MVSLSHELILLEKRLEKQRVSIQTVKLELNKNEEVVIDDKCGKGVVKYVDIQRKYSGAFVIDSLNKADGNLYADS